MSAIIEARGFVKHLGKVRALDALDPVAELGHVTALLGPNGAGKTTFVSAVATLVAPDAGAEPGRVSRVISLAGQLASIEPSMPAERTSTCSIAAFDRYSSGQRVQRPTSPVGDRPHTPRRNPKRSPWKEGATMAEKTDVVVIGGGYAGALAANHLTQRDDVAVTLINPRPDFVERIRLHQRVCGSDDAVVDFGEVLAERIQLVVDTVTRIDAAERSVTLETGGAVGYDYLIYAVGSATEERGVAGAAEFAYPISTLETADRMRRVLDDVPMTAPVTVVGAGPQGIEIASELAELGRTVTLVCGEMLGPYLHPRGRRSVAKRLAKLGVTVLEGTEARVTAVTQNAVQLSDGRELASEMTIWTAGFGVPDLASRSGLSTDAIGRLLTDETLTSVDDERIVAAGDSAAPSDLPLRMSCQAALPLGAHAADTVLSRIAGEQPAPITEGFYGQCISLGRGAGVFQFAHGNDVARGFHIGGRLGATVKEVICASTVKGLVKEARKPGSFKWGAKDDHRQELLQARHGETPTVAEPFA